MKRLALVAALALVAGCVQRPVALPREHKAPLLYVALGDSTVEGIGASSDARNYVAQIHTRLRAVYPRAAVINLGRGGATSADVLNDQLDRAILMKPNLVTLSVGPNDITGRVPVTDYEDNVATIFRRLTGQINAVIVVNLLPDLAATPRFRRSETESAVAELTVEFNAALERQAHRYGVEVVDLYKPSQYELPRRPELVASDGYHPSDLGYARWAELLWRGVEKRIGHKSSEKE